MPKKRDENETAFDTLQEILKRDAERDGLKPEPKPEPEKVSYRVKAGRKGGKIGGKRRLKTLTAKERTHIAQKAAKTRWSKFRKQDNSMIELEYKHRRYRFIYEFVSVKDTKLWVARGHLDSDETISIETEPLETKMKAEYEFFKKAQNKIRSLPPKPKIGKK